MSTNTLARIHWSLTHAPAGLDLNKDNWQQSSSILNNLKTYVFCLNHRCELIIHYLVASSLRYLKYLKHAMVVSFSTAPIQSFNWYLILGDFKMQRKNIVPNLTGNCNKQIVQARHHCVIGLYQQSNIFNWKHHDLPYYVIIKLSSFCLLGVHFLLFL